ncbi:hypothetical protein Efla_004698 [Eimeria flavescens]
MQEEGLEAEGPLPPRSSLWVLLFAVACCYVASSWVLNRWPHLLHRRREPHRPPAGKEGPPGASFQEGGGAPARSLKAAGGAPLEGLLEGPLPVLIAHRGGQAEAPENTLLAFRYSLEECGCDMIELDVWVTKDGQLVVVHDDDLRRVCGLDVKVSDLNFDALPPLLPSHAMEKQGAFFEFFPDFSGFPQPFGSERIPLLEDVYRAFPGALMNVDLKGPLDEAAVAAAVALTRKYKREKKTIFGGFLQEKLKLIKTLMPEAVVAVGPERSLLLVAAYYLGFLPFLPLWEEAFEFPISYAYLRREALRRAAEKRQRLPACLHFWCTDTRAHLKAWLSYQLLSNRGFIEALKRRGLLVLGWVANTEEEYEEAFDRVGCHGLMTDRPKHLKAYLDARRQRGRGAQGGPHGAPRKKTECLCSQMHAAHAMRHFLGALFSFMGPRKADALYLPGGSQPSVSFFTDKTASLHAAHLTRPQGPLSFALGAPPKGKLFRGYQMRAQGGRHLEGPQTPLGAPV